MRVGVFSDFSIESLLAIAMLKVAKGPEASLIFLEGPEDIDLEEFFENSEDSKYDEVYAIGSGLMSGSASTAISQLENKAEEVFILTDVYSEAFELTNTSKLVYLCDNSFKKAGMGERPSYLDTLRNLINSGDIDVNNPKVTTSEIVLSLSKMINGKHNSGLSKLYIIYTLLGVEGFFEWIVLKIEENKGLNDEVVRKAEGIVTYQSKVNEIVARNSYEAQFNLDLIGIRESSDEGNEESSGKEKATAEAYKAIAEATSRFMNSGVVVEVLTDDEKLLKEILVRHQSEEVVVINVLTLGSSYVFTTKPFAGFTKVELANLKRYLAVVTQQDVLRMIQG